MRRFKGFSVGAYVLSLNRNADSHDLPHNEKKSGTSRLLSSTTGPAIDLKTRIHWRLMVFIGVEKEWHARPDLELITDRMSASGSRWTVS